MEEAPASQEDHGDRDGKSERTLWKAAHGQGGEGNGEDRAEKQGRAATCHDVPGLKMR